MWDHFHISVLIGTCQCPFSDPNTWIIVVIISRFACGLFVQSTSHRSYSLLPLSKIYGSCQISLFDIYLSRFLQYLVVASTVWTELNRWFWQLWWSDDNRLPPFPVPFCFILYLFKNVLSENELSLNMVVPLQSTKHQPLRHISHLNYDTTHYTVCQSSPLSVL